MQLIKKHEHKTIKRNGGLRIEKECHTPATDSRKLNERSIHASLPAMGN